MSNEAKMIVSIIRDLKRYFPDKNVSIDKEYNNYCSQGYDSNGNPVIVMKYWLYIEGIGGFELNSLVDVIDKASWLVAQHDEEYKKRWLLKRHKWYEYYNEN